MKKIFLLLALALVPFLSFGQNPGQIASIQDTVIWSELDSSWLKVSKTSFVIEGDEDRFHTRWDTIYLGDTSKVKNQLINDVFQAQLQLARSYRLAIFSTQIDAQYSNNKAVYELITGEKWEVGTANALQGRFLGRYRILSDTANFLANIVVIPSGPNQGRLRMEREDNSDTWLINIKSAESFQAQNMRSYFESGGSGAIEFVWDYQDRQRRAYRPRDRSLGNKGNLPTALRIIKIQ